MSSLTNSGLELRLLTIGVVTGSATLCGGALALRIRSRLGVLRAFGCGAMIGVSLADLLPEALSLNPHRFTPLLLMAVCLSGFMAYMILAKARARATQGAAGRALGPVSLVAHSIMDGIGIGLAFSVSPSAGFLVATAVLTHDLVDGANTVVLSFSADNRRSWARLWLCADALAPLVGIGLSRLVDPSPAILAPLLAMFSGFFLYISTAELLPATKDDRTISGSLATLAGAAIVVAVARIGAA